MTTLSKGLTKEQQAKITAKKIALTVNAKGVVVATEGSKTGRGRSPRLAIEALA